MSEYIIITNFLSAVTVNGTAVTWQHQGPDVGTSDYFGAWTGGYARFAPTLEGNDTIDPDAAIDFDSHQIVSVASNEALTLASSPLQQGTQKMIFLGINVLGTSQLLTSGTTQTVYAMPTVFDDTSTTPVLSPSIDMSVTFGLQIAVPSLAAWAGALVQTGPNTATITPPSASAAGVRSGTTGSVLISATANYQNSTSVTVSGQVATYVERRALRSFFGGASLSSSAAVPSRWNP